MRLGRTCAMWSAAVVSALVPFAAGDVVVRQPARMDLPEAWVRGYLRATCEGDEQNRPLMFRLQSFREVTTDLNDDFWFLSPNAASPNYSAHTTQDVVLRSGY